MNPRTITCAAEKGGASKTTVGVQLALAAAREGPVHLIDADPQRSAVAWLTDAGPVAGLTVTAVSTLAELARARKVSAPTTIIDTAPGVGDPLGRAAMVGATLVLVPLRPTLGDLERWAPTAAAAAEAGAVAALVLSQVRRGTSAAKHARAVLAAAEDVLLCDVEIPMREAIASSWGTAAVVAPFGDLWNEIEAALAAIIEGR